MKAALLNMVTGSVFFVYLLSKVIVSVKLNALIIAIPVLFAACNGNSSPNVELIFYNYTW